MRHSPVKRFILRWFICSLGLWVAAGLLGDKISYGSKLTVIIWSGLLLAVVNTIVKPLVVILSLPAILLSLGLFMFVINGLMVLLVSTLYPQLQINGFGAAILAGLVIGLVNYLVSTIFDK